MAAGDSTAHCPSSSDTEFDAYWEEEARNPHRNRIRIGRQYQATIPPKLKSGESDGRKLEQLETLTWRRENDLSKDKLYDYFVLSRALGLFARFKEREKLITSELGSPLTTTSTTGTSGTSITATTTSDSIVNSSTIDTTHVNIGNNGNNPNNNSSNNVSSSNNNCASGASGSSTTKNGTLTIADDGRKGSNSRSKQNNLQTPTKHHQASANEVVDGEDRRVKSVTCKKQHLSVTLDDELHSMTKFVSTHHPNGISSDQSCTLKSLDARSDKWSLMEARLFAHALELYGKNFCSIKKAMPWKPAKSIIEQYYKKVTINSDTGSGGSGGGGGGGGGSSSSSSGGTSTTGSGGSGDLGGSSTQFNSSSNFNNGQRGSGKIDEGNKDDCHSAPQRSPSSTTNTSTSPQLSSSGSMVDSIMEKVSPKLEFETTLQVGCLTSGDFAPGHNLKAFSGSMDGKSVLKSPLAMGSVDDILGPEIKPVKAKPIFTSKGIDVTSNGHNGLMNSITSTATASPGNRGYLQFFQNGQLVLKLKGVHEGHWVQSEDSPSIPRLGKAKKSHHYNGKRQVLQVTSNDGHSSRASVVSEDMSADDAIDSSDDDSHGSSSIESRSLPSPSLGSSSLAVVANVTSASCPPPLTRAVVSTCAPSGGGKGSNAPRTGNCQAGDTSSNNNNSNTSSNGTNGLSSVVKRSESGLKRDSSSFTNDECSCGDSENCNCGNGSINGNCSKSKKVKSCNGSTSNRNVSNGLANASSDTSTSSSATSLSGTSYYRTSDSGKISGTSSNSSHRHSNNLDVASKGNYNGSRSHPYTSNSSTNSKSNSSSNSNPGSLVPPPLAHSSSASAVVDLSSKNASTCAQISQKSPSSGHKKLSSDGSDNCAVDLSVKASASSKVVTPSSGGNIATTGNLQYSKSSSLLNKLEAVDVKTVPSMASATGDNMLHSKKLVSSSESPPLPLPLPSANDGRSHAEWLQTMLKYEQYYRSVCSQLQIQKQQTSPGAMSGGSASAPGGTSRSKGVIGSSGAGTATSNSIAGSSMVEHKKSKHVADRKNSTTSTSSNINASGESGNGHHKKAAASKDLGRKV